MYSSDAYVYDDDVDYGESWTDADLLESDRYGQIISMKCAIYDFNDMFKAHYVFSAQEQQSYEETMLLLGDEITEREMTHLRNIHCNCTSEQVRSADCPR